jgi:hypothetical protein
MKSSDKLLDDFVKKYLPICIHNYTYGFDGHCYRYIGDKISQLDMCSLDPSKAGIVDKIFTIARESNPHTSKVNCNPRLICFQNGIYDLDLKLFRDGKPSDLITDSHQLSFDYKPLDCNSVDYARIQEYLMQLFPNHRIRKALLDYEPIEPNVKYHECSGTIAHTICHRCNGLWRKACPYYKSKMNSIVYLNKI